MWRRIIEGPNTFELICYTIWRHNDDDDHKLEGTWFCCEIRKKVSVAWEMPMLVQHHLTDNTCYEDICFCAIIRYCVFWIDMYIFDDNRIIKITNKSQLMLDIASFEYKSTINYHYF